ncbi:uncharacterized protein [Garra rufa]|uniref:uncharacterized protein n=1 Tax=Garra rufa TaxID=137080 RepID=UPI003CCE9F65
MCEGMSSWTLTHQCALLLFIHFMPICLAFLPNFWSRVLTLSWDSYTHQYMTEQAILNITMETLSGMKQHQHDVDNEELYTGLGRGFWHAVGEVASANAAMDFLSSTCSDPVYHFDSERVEGATQMLREFWGQTILLTKAKEYQGARHILGQLFHSLQDFYSHSNWVEMGQQEVYLHLLHPEEPSVPVASADTPTCAECYRFSCYSNLLEKMISQTEPLLTTGYFSTYPAKPTGKCSHGGILDSSRHQGAEGGINKDSTSPLFSPHHYLHKEAAHLATTATLRVLQDLRDAVGPKSFLRLFSVQQPPALVFVMDTTGSMFEEITAARLRALSIIQAREKSQRTSLPGTFILVPFHDPVLASYNKYNNNCYRDSLWLCLLNSCTSFVAGFAVFSVLGFMAQEQGVPIAEVAESGPGLAFIAYPQAVAMMPLPQFWAVCFFIMIILLGLDTQFVSLEAIMTSVMDLFPMILRRPGRREIFLLLLCLTCFLGQFIMVTEGGMYVFQLFDYYACNGACVLFLSVFESLAMGWIFGAERMFDIIEDMTKSRPNYMFMLCWKYLTPLVSLVSFVISLVEYTPLTFNRWYVYPDWAYALGWLLALSSIVLVPGWALGQLFAGKGSLKQRWHHLCSPDKELSLTCKQRAEMKETVLTTEMEDLVRTDTDEHENGKKEKILKEKCLYL